MQTTDLDRSLPLLLGELLHGTPESGGFVLNPDDRGMFQSLNGLSARQASASSNRGATIAAHVAHVRYGLSLLNRWAGGEENPFAGADWSEAWKVNAVSDDEWAELRRAFREEGERWLRSLRQPRALAGPALDGAIGSIVHLAYHLGAIRQIDPAARGPRQADHRAG